MDRKASDLFRCLVTTEEVYMSMPFEDRDDTLLRLTNTRRSVYADLDVTRQNSAVFRIAACLDNVQVDLLRDVASERRDSNLSNLHHARLVISEQLELHAFNQGM